MITLFTKEIIINKLLIPKELLQVRLEADCKTGNNFDLVICLDADKNGEITFPVYKKNILKNTYEVFLN